MRKLSRARLIGFTVVVTVGVLAGLDRAVEALEERGVVELYDRDLDVQHVVKELFTRQDEVFVVSDYARKTMVESSFAVDRGRAWRLFVVGGSFAMGEPYVSQDLPGALGGIPTYLQAALETFGTRPVEVVNAAAGGQDSNRVAAIVDDVSKHDPNAILIMTCNNEGAPPPSTVQTALVRQGGFRLLRAALASPEERGWFSLQDPEVDRVREAFRANLKSMIAAGKEAGARVYMATMPVNLEYEGFTLGHLTSKGPAQELPDVSSLVEPRDDLPADWRGLPPCVAGIQLAEAGENADAIVFLQHCLSGEAKGKDRDLARALPALAWAFLTQGQRVEAAKDVLRAGLDDCVVDGMAAVAGGRYDDAVELLEACREDVHEAVRWSGLAHVGRGEVKLGHALLQQAVELTPRNRCRPSFNQVIRDLAAEHPDVVLVDLQRAHAELPELPPARRWFLDFCHMEWRGYAEMGAEVFRAIKTNEEGLVYDDALAPSAQWIGEYEALPDGPVRDQWPWMMRRTGRY